MSRNTKILVGAASFLILALVLFFFFARKQSSTSSSGNNGIGQAVQNTLPSSQPAGSGANSSGQTNTASQDQTTISASNPPALPGKKTDAPEILDKYGKFAFETFRKYPELVAQIKILDKSFAPSQMDPSYPSHVYRTDGGKDFLLLGGCTEHNCGGTRIIVAYNLADNKFYLGKENNAGTQLQFFGNPGDQEKSIMINFYFQK